MARTARRQLTEAELRVMNTLWSKGQGTVGEVTEAIEIDQPLAYSTVLTTLRILEKKGFVRHTKEGRAFVYQPAIDREQASNGAVRHLLTRFFDDSPELLLANLLRHKRVDRTELAALKKLIDEQQRKEP